MKVSIRDQSVKALILYFLRMMVGLVALRRVAPRTYRFRFSVAQIFNLPYRRFVIGRRLLASDRWQVTNLRYSRSRVCATGAAGPPNTYRRTAEHSGVVAERRPLPLNTLLILISVIAARLSSQAELPLTRLSILSPPGGQAGTTFEVTLAAADLDETNRLHFSHTNIIAKQKLSEKSGEPDPTRFLVTIGADVPPGIYEVRAAGRFGASNPRGFVVGNLPEITSPGTNHTAASATAVALGTVVNGRSDANAVDYYQFSAKQGQRVLVECLARHIDSRLDDTLILYDASGRELERQRRGGLLDFIAPADGRFVLGVSDFIYRGGEEYFYRLTIGAGPHLDFVFPPSGQPGTKSQYTLYGRNLPGGTPADGLSIDGKPLEQLAVEIELPDAPAARRNPPTGLALKPAEAVVDGIEYRLNTGNTVSSPLLLSFAAAPVVREQEPNSQPEQAQQVPIPCELVGQFYPAGDRDWLSFEAKKGEVYWIEAFSHRLGLPTAPFALVQRVTRNEKGEAQASDVTELYASDANIGGPEFNTSTRDPSGRFEVKEDGVYRVRISDLFNRYENNPRFVYRLSVRKETPDFNLVALPQAPPPLNKDAKEAVLWTPLLRRGETVPIKVLAFRRGNFDGEIQLGVDRLPRGTFSAGKIEKNKNSGLLFLTAADDAENWSGPIKVTGKARVADSELVREARAGTISWTVPDYNNEAVRPRLTRELFLTLSGVESAPITIEPAENRTWEAVLGTKLQIPLKITRRGEFNETLKLKATGVPGLDGLQELSVDGKTNAAALDIDPGQQKLSAGAYTFYLLAQTKGKYRNNPEAAREADEAAKEAEKLAADLAVEAKKASEMAAVAARAAEEAATQAVAAAAESAAAGTAAETSPPTADLIAARDAAEIQCEAAVEKEQLAAQARTAADNAAAEALAKVKEAEAQKTAAASRAKAANERAKPRDVTVTVYSVPISFQVKADEKK